MDVRALQERLRALGFDPGPVDGQDGPRTYSAVIQFQQSRGLVPDGKVGPKTEAALAAEPADPAAPVVLNPISFSRFAPAAVAGTREALEAAIAAHPELQDRGVLAIWLGQMHVESAGFSRLKESLNYSVEGLLQTFGRHRISAEDCARLGRTRDRPADQEAIANILYGGAFGRAQLGNTEPGDGWRFRGGGFKQITGRANYERYGVTLEDLQDPARSADVAARFFIDAGCVGPARAGDIATVTRRINGGMNGYDQRVQQTAAARQMLGG